MKAGDLLRVKRAIVLCKDESLHLSRSFIARSDEVLFILDENVNNTPTGLFWPETDVLLTQVLTEQGVGYCRRRGIETSTEELT